MMTMGAANHGKVENMIDNGDFGIHIVGPPMGGSVPWQGTNDEWKQ